VFLLCLTPGAVFVSQLTSTPAADVVIMAHISAAEIGLGLYILRVYNMQPNIVKCPAAVGTVGGVRV